MPLTKLKPTSRRSSRAPDPGQDGPGPSLLSHIRLIFPKNYGARTRKSAFRSRLTESARYANSLPRQKSGLYVTATPERLELFRGRSGLGLFLGPWCFERKQVTRIFAGPGWFSYCLRIQGDHRT
jgi:hypothetical protein